MVELNANDDGDNGNHDQRLFLLQMQRDEDWFSGIYLSAFVHGKKGTKQEILKSTEIKSC